MNEVFNEVGSVCTFRPAPRAYVRTYEFSKRVSMIVSDGNYQNGDTVVMDMDWKEAQDLGKLLIQASMEIREKDEQHDRT